MNLYPPAKCLKVICATLLACSLSLLGVCILPFTDPWIEHCATAATQGDGIVSGTDEADFSQSEMLCPDHKIREGDTIDYQIILRNTGSKRPDYVELWVDPISHMLASAPGLSYNLENRELHWRGTVDPGGEQRFTVRLVTIPKSAGTWVSNRASIVWATWVSSHASFWDTKKEVILCDPLEVRSKERKARILFTVFGIGFGWLEVGILGYLVFAPLFLIVIPRLIRRRERQLFESSPDVSWGDDKLPPIVLYGTCIFFLVCLPMTLFFGSFVFEDIRRFTSYAKTTCTVLDKKVGPLARSRGDYPILAVRYDAGGKEIVSVGSLASASTGGTSAEKKIARYKLGRSYPCWFDPEDPRKFVLKRGDISWGVYFLFVPVLIAFFFSSRYLFKKLRGPDTKSQLFNAPIQ